MPQTAIPVPSRTGLAKLAACSPMAGPSSCPHRNDAETICRKAARLPGTSCARGSRSPKPSISIGHVGVRRTDLVIVGHPGRPNARIEVFGIELAGLHLRNPPRFQVVLLVEAHQLPVINRVGALYPKILRVVGAADADRAEVVDFAALALADCKCFALGRGLIERMAVGGEARVELLIGRVHGILGCRRHVSVRRGVGAFSILPRLGAVGTWPTRLNVLH